MFLQDINILIFCLPEDLDPDEVADFISTIMDTEFNTLVEDDSDLEVS